MQPIETAAHGDAPPAGSRGPSLEWNCRSALEGEPMHRRSIRSIVAAAALALSVTGIAAVSPSGASAKTMMYHVALGDSYAEGYQPGYPASQLETLHGYNNQVDALLKPKHPMTLENFGCGGATTTSILHSIDCPAYAAHGVHYPTTTQAAAALAFISAHPGQIGLITISIGGNDFDNCIGQTDAVTCVSNAMAPMKANVETLVSELRAAAGPTVAMIATTYPDVVLGAWVATPPNIDFAKLSITAFGLLINPNLAAAYAASNVTFVNVTSATGAFTPLTTTTKLAPYGTIPVAVAKVCTLTWFCAKGDIHPKPAGYTLIAKLVATAYAKLVK